MPSLYKGIALDTAAKVSIPVAEIKTKPTQLNPGDEMFEKAVEIMAETLFQERWKAFQANLAMERGRMLAEVDAEREQVRARAEREGFEAGVKKSEAEAAKLMRQVQESYKMLEADRLRFIEENRQQITELVVAVTEQFMQEQMERTPELLVNMMAQATHELVSRRKICVFVHPSKVETVGAYAYLFPGSADGNEILIRPDPSLDIHSFRVEDDSGAIAVSLSEHIQNMRQVLADA